MNQNIELQRAKMLFSQLGINAYSPRHSQIVIDFLEDGGEDLEMLLSNLGSWNEQDLKIAKEWYNEINSSM